MDGLHRATHAANRPAFLFAGQPELTVDAVSLSSAVPGGQLGLTGPADRSDKPHLPVRGDLAHIGLAGKYFVPHYAVPMSRKVAAATALADAGRDGAATIRELAAGETFDVLDIAGGHAWGQATSDGLVGYVALSALEPAA